MADPDVDALMNKYKSGSNSTTTNDVDVDALMNKYKSAPAEQTPAEPIAPPAPIQSAQKQALPLSRNIPGAAGALPGAARGILSAASTLNELPNIGDSVDRLFKFPNSNNYKTRKESIEQASNKLDTDYGDLRGYEAGKVGGQMLATAPLIPGAAISTGMKTIFGAMPTKLAGGEIIAAPMARRLAASSGTGGVVGGAFGALTSGDSEASLGENIGHNALAGMVGGPVVEGAGSLASKVAPALKSAYYNTKLNYFTHKYGITPQAAKNVLTAFENEGMSLADAEAKLLKFGPNATIGDLTPALQQFVGALGKRGDISSRAASITKNRYAARADTADDRAVDEIVNKNLGPHKDVSLERGQLSGKAADDIHEAAQAATAGDRAKAYANPTKLSVYGLIGEIDTKLEKAAGDAIPALEKARGILFKQVKDPVTGQKVAQVRTSVEDLHESRKALDYMLDPKRSDRLPTGVASIINDIRGKVDAQLKTIPEMAAHDIKFSKQMDIKEGLKIGYEALNKGNRFSFNRTFDAAPPEVQQTIREGMRAKIGDHMDNAAKGELSGAAQLFADRALTRHKLVKAFGAKGEEALEALEKHIVMRATERFAATGSITNAAERINSALDMQGSSKGPVKEAAKGAVLDAFAGTPGYIATLRGAGAAGSNIASKVAAKRHDLNVESLADLVSRSGTDRYLGISVVRRVDAIQQKIKTPRKEIKLPVVLSAPIGDPIQDKGIKIGKYGGETVKDWINQIPSFD